MPLLDVLETVSNLHQRKWLDDGLIENSFSVPVRYWWRALESHVAKMRSDYHDATIYERCKQLAVSYGKAESVGRPCRRFPNRTWPSS
ncbi:hypothetical protein [Janthinobacterium agaricidamnosum]|uniref:hypothetical protein n=1 Tax=Janthinobacterium agaricidamnosum TaxID=55508 RepID=UPI00056E0190|nr:hypothetical protein [Janthinobacterium agaricidamnosum]